MAASMNGKSVLFNDRIIFAEGAVVDFNSSFPLRMKANAAGAGDIHLTLSNGVFTVEINGLSSTTYDRLGRGDGVLKGQAFEYWVHASLVANMDGANVYDVGITIFAV